MKKKALLSASERTRIASSLYKLAIRVMQLSKRPLDTAQVTKMLDKAGNGRLTQVISVFSPAESQGFLQTIKPPSIQTVLATRTTVPEQGDGIRVDIVFGPFYLLEDEKKDLGVIRKSTVARPGLAPDKLYPMNSLYNLANSVFGGVLSQHKLPILDAKDVSDKPYYIDHSYDREVGDKAWKILHTSGPKKDQVALYENPRIKAKMSADAEIDPWVPAIFDNGPDASRVLNQLTRGTSHSSRLFPKFREYTAFLSYSSVHLKSPSNGDASFYSVYDLLLSSVDTESDSTSAKTDKAIITQALDWLREKSVSPDTLMATLENKNPEMAKKLKSLLPAIERAWSVEQDSSQESVIKKLIKTLRTHSLTPDKLLESLNAKNPALLVEINKIMPSPSILALTDKIIKLLPSLERAWLGTITQKAV